MGSRERHMRQRSKTHAIPLIIVSLVGFLFIAGIAFGVGMLGNINRWLSDLPDYTDPDQYMVSEPTTVLDANGTEIATLYVQNRESVTIDQVSQYVLDGTVATEDERFYEHNGVDLIGIARAVIVQLTGGSEGASTITQQLVRNTILSEEQFDNTIERKVREAFIAVKMEEVYSKEEILMMYLNTIYYGHGAYGIETAAQTYLSKSAKDLTLAEAALLVGLPNAPSRYDPTVNPDYAIQRRNTVLNRMCSNGKITEEERDAAQAEPLTLNVNSIPESGTLAHPYFVDYVKSLLQEEFSSDMIFKGGLTVKTTIDPILQATAEQTAVERMNAEGADELQVGMVVVDPKTGYIKAMVGGKDYYADENHVNHALSRRSTGSSFKTFTLAAAIKAGMSPNVLLNCSSPLKVWGTEFSNYGNHNYGERTLASATAVSSNTGYVQVAEAIGNQKIIDMCASMGIDTTDEIANFQDVPSLTLGTASITPLEMAEAYTALANGGYHREAVAITEITSRTGKVIYQHEDDPDQIMTTGEAEAVTGVLKGVMSSGGTGYYGRPNIDQPVAGKTGTAGTASRTSDLWFVGYTPELVCSIWTGRSGTNASFSGYGTADLPLPIFKAFMTQALSGVAREEFPEGDTPDYKANSSWDFSGSKYKDPDEEEEDENKEEEEGTETPGEGTETGGNTGGTTGGNTGGNTGGSTGGGNTGDGNTGGGNTGGGNTGGGTGGGDTGGGNTGGGETTPPSGGGDTGGGSTGGGETTPPSGGGETGGGTGGTTS